MTVDKNRLTGAADVTIGGMDVQALAVTLKHWITLVTEELTSVDQEVEALSMRVRELERNDG